MLDRTRPSARQLATGGWRVRPRYVDGDQSVSACADGGCGCFLMRCATEIASARSHELTARPSGSAPARRDGGSAGAPQLLVLRDQAAWCVRASVVALLCPLWRASGGGVYSNAITRAPAQHAPRWWAAERRAFDA